MTGIVSLGCKKTNDPAREPFAGLRIHVTHSGPGKLGDKQLFKLSFIMEQQ